MGPEMIRIGFDARMIAHSGIGTYSRELLNGLAADPQFDLTLFGNPVKITDFLARKIVCDYPIYSFKEQFLFPTLIGRENLDLMHFPHYNVPLGYRRPFVVTVHDCIHLLFPKSRPAYFYAKTLMASACRRAEKVITDSENTKSDLLRLLNVPEKKIEVIFPGVADSWIKKQEPSSCEPEKGGMFAGEFALYVGNVRPTKNVTTLVKAFEEASKKTPMKLILAGKNSMPEWTEQYKGRQDILFLGEVSQQTIFRLYNKAKMFIFPSSYEGFGLPVLEAMASEVPVISSNASSLPEVAGDAALFFEPNDAQTLARHLSQLWESESLRGELIRKGRENVKRFRWETCVERTAQVYRECAK